MKTVPQFKIDFVKQLEARYRGEKDFFFAEYRGLTVEQLTVLRGRLQDFSADLKVVKNNLAKIAFKNLECKDISDYLKGPTTVVSVGQGASNQVARVLRDYMADTSLVIKGGLVEGEVYTAHQVVEYSKLPTRLEVVVQFIAVLDGAMYKLARTLKAFTESKRE